MGLLLTKPVFGVSDKARFKPVSSATETSYKIENLLVASLHMIISNMLITKALISLWGCLHLCCSQTPKTGFLNLRPICCILMHLQMQRDVWLDDVNLRQYILWYTVGILTSLCNVAFHWMTREYMQLASGFMQLAAAGHIGATKYIFTVFLKGKC